MVASAREQSEHLLWRFEEQCVNSSVVTQLSLKVNTLKQKLRASFLARITILHSCAVAVVYDHLMRFQ